MKSIIVMIMLGLLSFGCSSKQVTKEPADIVRSICNTVSVQVTALNVDPSVSLPISKDVLDTLTREIKGQLIIAGFMLDQPSDKAINLDVNVTAFSPGNAGLRFLIGFGAGRGSLLYTAKYVDSEGNILAEMDGQERFTGGEVGFNQRYGVTTTLGGHEVVAMVLVKEAAKHIVELATMDYNK